MFLIKIDKTQLNNVFILEDDKYRINYFKEVFSFLPVIYVTKNPAIALEILKDKKFDLIFLDHDLYEDPLDYGMGEEPEELTGLFVAKGLKNTVNKLTNCIVHSMNPVGASNMIKAHPFNTVHIPYAMLEDNIIFI